MRLSQRLGLQQDGQALFVTLYRSWCHNAVSVFSLCLLAQAYEHASNLLSILSVHIICHTPQLLTLYLAIVPNWRSRSRSSSKLTSCAAH